MEHLFVGNQKETQLDIPLGSFPRKMIPYRPHLTEHQYLPGASPFQGTLHTHSSKNGGSTHIAAVYLPWMLSTKRTSMLT